MKTFLRLFTLLVLSLATLHAAEDKSVKAARAADDERLAATKSGERARLDAIFSDELHYAHSSGRIDSKASYIDALAAHTLVYESFDYKERNFKAIAPGIVLMTGRVLIKATSGGARADNDLNFLAVWREENGGVALSRLAILQESASHTRGKIKASRSMPAVGREDFQPGVFPPTDQRGGLPAPSRWQGTQTPQMIASEIGMSIASSASAGG